MTNPTRKHPPTCKFPGNELQLVFKNNIERGTLELRFSREMRGADNEFTTVWLRFPPPGFSTPMRWTHHEEEADFVSISMHYADVWAWAVRTYHETHKFISNQILTAASERRKRGGQ